MKVALDDRTAETLARRVQRLHPELSFSRAKRAVERGQVSVNGAVVQEPGRRVPADVFLENGDLVVGGDEVLAILILQVLRAFVE